MLSINMFLSIIDLSDFEENCTRETYKLRFGVTQLFFWITQLFFSNKGYQKADELLNTQ